MESLTTPVVKLEEPNGQRCERHKKPLILISRISGEVFCNTCEKDPKGQLVDIYDFCEEKHNDLTNTFKTLTGLRMTIDKASLKHNGFNSKLAKALMEP